MIEVSGLDQLDKATARLLKKLDKKERKKILRKAAAPIREDARSLISDANDYVYRYSTPKVSGKLRAPKGMGNIVATYIPGNLKKSIQTLNFRRSPDVFVGPKVNKKGGQGTFGRTVASVDAYYAHMVHNGTSEQPGQPFMTLAFQAKKGEALRIIRKELKTKIETP